MFIANLTLYKYYEGDCDMAKNITKDQILDRLHLRHDDAAKDLGISRGTLTRYKKLYDITIGSGNTLIADRKCSGGRPSVKESIDVCCPCGAKFDTKRYEQKYCSHECYSNYRVVTVSNEQKDILSEKAKLRWKNPTANMLSGIDKRKMSDEQLKDFRKYRNRLKTLTEHTYKMYSDVINPNNLPRGIAGQEGAYHLDHKVPARFGYENGIPPEVLAEKNNLQMLSWYDNIVKGKKIDEATLGNFDI